MLLQARRSDRRRASKCNTDSKKMLRRCSSFSDHICCRRRRLRPFLSHLPFLPGFSTQSHLLTDFPVHAASALSIRVAFDIRSVVCVLTIVVVVAIAAVRFEKGSPDS